MSRIAPLPLSAAAFLAAIALTCQPSAAGGPALVELFTSQGCSSCPPADRVLSELAGREDVVALSLHVDYWDYLGWQDTFASPAFTRRQIGYRDAWGERAIYTPQLVVGGELAVSPQRPHEIEAAIAAEGADDAGLTLAIGEADGMLAAEMTGAFPSGATVWIARYLDAADVEIERGENAGERITYRNVVTVLRRAAPADGRIALPRPRPGEGVAVWVQAAGQGEVLAAARHTHGTVVSTLGAD